MDGCISDLVVTDVDDSFVVQQVPISIMDGNFENVGIAHLVHSGMHSNQVIRVSSNQVPKELHPLEADIQRDLELKRRQQLLCRPNSTTVIHSVPESIHHSPTLKTFQLCHEPITIHGEGIQHIIQGSKTELMKPNTKSDTMSHALAHVFQTGKQVLLDGKPSFIFVEGNPQIITQSWDMHKEQIEPGEHLEGQLDNGQEPAEAAHIPLTVQNYSHTEEVATDAVKPKVDVKVMVFNKSKSNKSPYRFHLQKYSLEYTPIEETDSENEGEEIEPVRDHEPDPEPENEGMFCDEDESKPNKCYVCFKSFRQKKNMYAHIRRIHSRQPKIEGGILCPLCRMHALRQEHLRNHLMTLHDVKVEKEERLFASMDEFFAWKEHIERETLSLYVSKSSAKLLANNQQKSYFKCHRSGNYASDKNENRKKRLKMQGSNKIGATCPAAMEVTENIHGVTVIFWKTHVGHSKDLEHLVLSKEERSRITEFLGSGVPWDQVMDRIKQETQKATNVSPRLTMISKQDLRNMKKNHDMKVYPELFPARKKVNLGRKPVKERMLRRASQALVVEKAEVLLNILETTDVIAEFRPKVCLMIDNLISTVKRRAVKNVYNRENNHKRRKKQMEKWRKNEESKNHETQSNGNAESNEDEGDFETGNTTLDESSQELTDIEKSVATQTVDTESQATQTLQMVKDSVIKSPRKRGRPKKVVAESTTPPKHPRQRV